MVDKKTAFSANQVLTTVNEMITLPFVSQIVSRMFSQGDFGIGYVCQPIFKDGHKVFKVYMFISDEDKNNGLYEMFKR
jgi:hypothetical protein